MGKEIRRAEVHHQLHAHHAGAAPGNIGITAEITVNLEGKGAGGHHQGAAGICRDIAVHRIHPHGKIGRGHALFEKAPGHQLEPGDGVVIREGMLLLQLGQEVFRPLDGPGHQLGEIGDKQGERDEIPLRGQLSPVDVDGVAEGLEGIK